MISATDAMGHTVSLHHPASRVVSLVPSETETVVTLGGIASLIARTEYCVQPMGLIESVPTVGGTKNADCAKIIALKPDLVLCNQEENTPAIVAGLRDAGLNVHVSFPKTVDEGRGLVGELARLLGVPSHPALVSLDSALERVKLWRAGVVPVRVFCPIWMDPLMTIHGETFISDALDLAGMHNVFCDRPRRYPLAADIGTRPALTGEKVAGRDTRYPRVTLQEVIARAPELILLPDEPHAFSEADAAVFRALPIANLSVEMCEGRALCWYSTAMGEGLWTLVEQLRGRR
jgi:ABC-type Fe3+-hydroxamate transport system substrate-binding protein